MDAATGMTSRRVLVLNAGSTSLKFGIFDAAEGICVPLESAEADGNDVAAIAVTLARWPAPDIVGHRIVHGGPDVRDHCLIDPAVLADLEAAKALAPLHVPPALAGVRFAMAHFPNLPQVACLDTAFHVGMPDIATTYPLPEDVRAAGVIRYGFHGLSCASIVRQLGADVPEHLVIAHLGGGCSVTAVRGGRSIDTSMGLTPSGGLMMASRAGDLDPGVLLYLMRERGMDADSLEQLVDRRGGLLGVSGLSADLRTLNGTSWSRGGARRRHVRALRRQGGRGDDDRPGRRRPPGLHRRHRRKRRRDSGGDHGCAGLGGHRGGEVDAIARRRRDRQDLVEPGPLRLFTRRLCRVCETRDEPLRRLALFPGLHSERLDMDFIFIAAGVGLFAAFAGYAALLRRI